MDSCTARCPVRDREAEAAYRNVRSDWTYVYRCPRHGRTWTYRIRFRYGR